MSYRFHSTATLAAFAMAALPVAVQAQSNAQSAANALNPVVVTAALAPRTANDSLSSVTVLDEATLRRQDPVSITDLFRGQPGVDVSTNGSFGKNSSVFIRGSGSGQNVLLIDGIRLRSATSGGAAWQHLEPRMFDRAEIVRGPRGSLYGADAIGGVIQLFTPQGEEEGPQPRISVGGGSFNTQRLSAGISGKEGGTRYSFAASHFTTDGQPIRRDGDDKGYDNTTALARVSHTFASGAEAGVLALRARGHNEYDGGENDFVQQVAGIYGELPITDNWRSRLTLSESRDESDNINSFGDSVFNTKVSTARWENTLTAGAHELIAGAEYSEDRVKSTTAYDETSRSNVAVFTQALLDFAPFTVQASLRFDDNEAYGEEVTGSVGVGYDLDAYHTLRANYGTAFNAPTYNQLYYPGFGNPDLESETSQSIEVGVRGQYAHWFWDAALYQTDIDNLIAGQGLLFNVPETRIRGAELAAGVELDDWTLAAALTYTDPENRLTGKRLQNRASQSLRLDVDRELGDWSVGGSWIAQNHRYRDTQNQDRLSGYGQVNLRAGWQFAPLWSARVTLENVLDQDYITTRSFDGADYLNAGRAGFLSVHYGQ
ncbi:TonB-dependent receptor domain-containing protein [Vreelandella venusta]|uniref:TonB-dependent receptor n=1 Tax=Vreelandella venusta TaxID=44935 RepID=A0ABX2BGY5_9GAMM|nr:TonB-dependent receptor [Halomonas venusta]AZM95532.1 TonB-dependent receptor [Halomonas venusta]NPT32571.1 TonB-dependent receptor [Halomonas venusta]WAM53398.1 TonB-dependent receptor [Halomonas venusta]